MRPEPKFKILIETSEIQAGNSQTATRDDTTSRAPETSLAMISLAFQGSLERKRSFGLPTTAAHQMLASFTWCMTRFRSELACTTGKHPSTGLESRTWSMRAVSYRCRKRPQTTCATCTTFAKSSILLLQTTGESYGVNLCPRDVRMWGTARSQLGKGKKSIFLRSEF